MASSGDAPRGPRAGRREWAALAVLALAVLLLAVDGTVLSLAVPALSEALDPSATELLWIGDAYSFALAGLLVTMGTLGDRIGRKRLLLIGAAGFAGASLLAAFAPTAGWLIAARALLGVAGATIMPATLSIIRDLFRDPRQRTTAVAVWGAMATAGAAVGPLIGGALLEQFWWGSVFVINLPVMALLIVLGVPLIPESRDPAPGPFDPISALLSLAGIVPLVYGIKELAAHGLSAGAVAGLAVGVLGAVLFVRRQRTLATPLIDVGLFRTPMFSGAVAANLLSDSEQVAGGDHGGQCPFGATAALQQPVREVRPGAQLRDRHVDRAGAGVEVAVPVAVAGVGAGVAAFAPAGAAHGVGLGGHQGVDEGGQHLAQ
jgi:MFS transporter, DHA2 family, multidrug resistance protein